MVSAARRYALHVWAMSVYWTSKAAGVLVAETTTSTVASRHEFTATAADRWQWIKTRAWNVACLAAVVHRIRAETLPVTVQATRVPGGTCYDTVCGGVWCVYACVYYAVAWLDRTSEIVALSAALVWRRRSTVECLNSAVAGCSDDSDESDDDDGSAEWPSVADVPWHAYLIFAFPVLQFATAANAISPTRDGVWRAMAAVASCAPVTAHGTAAALLVVANNSMRSINCRITRLSPAGRCRCGRGDPWRRDVVARLAHKHWWTTELVTGGVCHAYGVDLMAAVLLAAVRVTYVAISVFHRLTDDTDDEENARTNMSLAVIVQLFAWFGQFAYLAYACDELATQSSVMFDNLNSLLMDIYKESRLSGETYSSKMQEIEKVQEFMRQVVARKVIVHACGGLITLNLSLITTIIGVTLTYFIVLLQFESSHGNIHNNTATP